MSLALPAVTISAALAGLDAVGCPSDMLLQSAGVRHEQLADPFAVVPDAAFRRLWAAALAHDPDPALPVRAGMATPFGAFGILDHLVGAAQTVGEAMQTLALFFRLVSTTITLELRHAGGDSIWLINTPPSPTDRVSDAWTLALIVGRMRTVSEQFVVEQLLLVGSSSGEAARLAELFQAPVVQEQVRSGLRLRPGAWRARLHTTNPALYATLHTLATRADVAAFTADPLQHALRSQLDSAFRSDARSIGEAAAQLGVSVRTLQRRLAEEQLSFQQLLDAFRHERAMQLLDEGQSSIGDVAYALGYAEQSAFTRAFRRWTGVAPRTWLAEQRQHGRQAANR
jgi:AraC-like DNA-binding protein